MKRVLITVVLAAIAVIPWPSAVVAGGAGPGGGKGGSTAAMAARGSSSRQQCDVRGVRGFGGFRHFGFTSVGGPSFLIVDAVPAEAQVFLDGRPLGSAAELLARALPLGPVRHIVQVVAPGVLPYAAQFVADPSFSSRFRVALSHE